MSSSYNEYSPKQREASSRYMNELIRRGLYQRPTVCVACGQDKGVIDSHLEDYSEPFDVGRVIPLCAVRCHVFAVHLRGRYPMETAMYRDWVRHGYRAPPLVGRPVGIAIRDHVRFPGSVQWAFVGEPVRFWLDEIAFGSLCPAGRIPGNAPWVSSPGESERTSIQTRFDWDETNVTITKPSDVRDSE